MSIAFRILGTPGNDNALLVEIDSGQSIERLLFDCGEGCLSGLSLSEIQGIDHLFFSHLHMDHVAGFDSFFRCVFNRDTAQNRIWGPPDTARIFHHRFQAFLWNLHEQMSATWRVTDIHPHETRTCRYELREAFANAYEEAPRPYPSIICEGIAFTIETVTMDHRTPTIAYVVREKPRQNIDPQRMASLGLRPGPWLKQVKDFAPSSDTPSDARISVGDATYDIQELRQLLLVETPGDSVAYLTDFLLDEAAMDRLSASLRGVCQVICEGQYRHADLELARKHHHTTTVQTATLAKRAGVEQLSLFHLSARYERGEWLEMLQEARAIFPRTSYPAHWQLDPAR